MPRGGFRFGAGRKPKAARVLALHGSRRAPKNATAPESKPEAPLEPVKTPAGLAEDEQAVWDELSGHATAQGTLRPATVAAFRDLCGLRARAARWLRRIEAEGETFMKVSVDGAGVEHQEPKAHPLMARYNAALIRIETGMARFKLAPTGKELTATVKEVDPFEEFDGASVQ